MGGTGLRKMVVLRVHYSMYIMKGMISEREKRGPERVDLRTLGALYIEI